VLSISLYYYSLKEWANLELMMKLKVKELILLNVVEKVLYFHHLSLKLDLFSLPKFMSFHLILDKVIQFPQD